MHVVLGLLVLYVFFLGLVEFGVKVRHLMSFLLWRHRHE